MRVAIFTAALSLALWGCADIEVAPGGTESGGEATCSPGALRCAESGEPVVEQCDETGTRFVFAQECGSGQFCDAGGCRGTPQQQTNKGGCGPVSKKGCCAGATLRYCDGSQVVDVACDAGCGWMPETVQYECGGPVGADPTGGAPRACP